MDRIRKKGTKQNFESLSIKQLRMFFFPITNCETFGWISHLNEQLCNCSSTKTKIFLCFSLHSFCVPFFCFFPSFYQFVLFACFWFFFFLRLLVSLIFFISLFFVLSWLLFSRFVLYWFVGFPSSFLFSFSPPPHSLSLSLSNSFFLSFFTFLKHFRCLSERINAESKANDTPIIS